MRVQEEQQVLDVLATSEKVENLHDRGDDRDEHEHHHGEVVRERASERTAALLGQLPARRLRTARANADSCLCRVRSANCRHRRSPMSNSSPSATASDAGSSGAAGPGGSGVKPASPSAPATLASTDRRWPPPSAAPSGGWVADRTSENTKKNTTLVTTYMPKRRRVFRPLPFEVAARQATGLEYERAEAAPDTRVEVVKITDNVADERGQRQNAHVGFLAACAAVGARKRRTAVLAFAARRHARKRTTVAATKATPSCTPLHGVVATRVVGYCPLAAARRQLEHRP